MMMTRHFLTKKLIVIHKSKRGGASSNPALGKKTFFSKSQQKYAAFKKRKNRNQVKKLTFKKVTKSTQVLLEELSQCLLRTISVFWERLLRAVVICLESKLIALEKNVKNEIIAANENICYSFVAQTVLLSIHFSCIIIIYCLLPKIY